MKREITLLFLTVVGLLVNVQLLAAQDEDILTALAREGSGDSLQQLLRLLEDEKVVDEYIEGGAKVYYRTLMKVSVIVAQHQTEDAFNFLKDVIDGEVSPKVSELMYASSVASISKFNNSHEKQILELFSEQIKDEEVYVDAVSRELEFLNDTYYFDSKDRNYVDNNGVIIHMGSIVSDNNRSTILVSALLGLNSESAYFLLKNHLSSLEGLDSGVAYGLAHQKLKEVRYLPSVINIYADLIADTRYTKSVRGDYVEQFLDNSSEYYSGFLDSPESFFPQISEAGEESLKMILSVVNYSLRLDFLRPETVELVEAKRNEIINRLVSMGHNSEELNEVVTLESSPISVANGHSEPRSTINEPTKEVAEQFSNWWMWVVGLTLVVGGVLIFRLKK